MKNRICEMFGIEAPIFAFSHCRDVVVEVSKAGGLGVLGMARMSADRVDAELSWIDEHIDGRPYGVDILMPTTFQDHGGAKHDPARLLPAEHLDFVRDILDAAGIPSLPEDEAAQIERDLVASFNFTPEESMRMIEIAMRHPISLIVNALGSPPRAMVERAHARGIRVAAMAGAPRHALRHREAGCDFVIAVGTEAGGHTGNVTSMTLWPRIVDAVAPMPVLAAGGIGRGRQLAAALALGCEGAWCGSIWLKTKTKRGDPRDQGAPFRRKGRGCGADPERDRQALPHAAQRLHRRLGHAGRPRTSARAAAGHPVVGQGPDAGRTGACARVSHLSGRADRRGHDRGSFGPAGCAGHADRACRHRRNGSTRCCPDRLQTGAHRPASLPRAALVTGIHPSAGGNTRNLSGAPCVREVVRCFTFLLFLRWAG